MPSSHPLNLTVGGPPVDRPEESVFGVLGEDLPRPGTARGPDLGTYLGHSLWISRHRRRVTRKDLRRADGALCTGGRAG